MQLEILRTIQSISNPVLDIIAEGITLFGEQMILTAVFCAIYWCVDKRLGRFLALCLGFSLCVNGAVKDFFKVERLFGAEGIVSRRLETATGYSFPSGHTQTATAFWGGMAVAAKRPWLKAATAVLVLLVGFSRLYLGVHYPSDVIGGLVIGFVCVLLFYLAESGRLSKAVILPLCLIALTAVLVVGETPDTFKGAGIFLGIIVGIYLEEKHVGFETGGINISKKLLRYIFGMSVTALCYIVPKLLLPETNPVYFLRYTFLALIVTCFCPYIFRKIKL